VIALNAATSVRAIGRRFIAACYREQGPRRTSEYACARGMARAIAEKNGRVSAGNRRTVCV
jgi:hypothetical protein